MKLLRHHLHQNQHLWLRPLIVIGLFLIMLYILCILKFADKSDWILVLVCIATIIGLRSWRAEFLQLNQGPFEGYERIFNA